MIGEHLVICDECFERCDKLVEQRILREERQRYMAGRSVWGVSAWSFDKEKSAAQKIADMALTMEEEGAILIRGDGIQYRKAIFFLQLHVASLLREQGKEVLIYTPWAIESLFGPNDTKPNGKYLIINGAFELIDFMEFIKFSGDSPVAITHVLNPDWKGDPLQLGFNYKEYFLKPDPDVSKEFCPMLQWEIERTKRRIEENATLKDAYFYVCLLDAFDIPTPLSLLARILNKSERDLSLLIDEPNKVIYRMDTRDGQKPMVTTAGEAIAQEALDKLFKADNVVRLNGYRKIIKYIDPQNKAERYVAIKLFHLLIQRSNRRLVKKILEADEAKAKKRELWTNADSPQELLAWGKILGELRDEEAVEVFEEGLKRFSDNPYLLHAYIRVMSLWGRYDKAHKWFHDADSDNIYILQAIGDMEREMGYYKLARDRFDEAIDKDPNNFYAWVSKGDAEAGLGFYEEAKESFDEALRLDPGNLYAKNAWGVMEARRGRYDEAVKHFKSVLERDPENVPTLNAWGVMEKERGHWREAEQLFRKALKADPENLLTLNVLGDLKADQGHWKAEQEDYEAAEALFKEAEELFKQALDIDPWNMKIKVSYATMKRKWGEAELQRGHEAKAREHFRKAEGLLKEAQDYLREYNCRWLPDGKHPHLLHAEGELRLRRGDYEGAREKFEEIGENVAALTSLAKLTARENIEKARKLFEKAVKEAKKPKHKHIDLIITYNAWAEAEAKNFEEAEEHFKESLNEDPENALTHWAYAEMLRSAGRPEAEEHFNKAWELGMSADSLHQLYSFINPESEIINFIIEHNLWAFLLEAPRKIRHVFGNDIALELELHHDPEEDFEGLFITIKTNLSPEDSLNLLDKLDEEWWLYVNDDISNILEIMVRPT
jgi:tetratricopeptide (TPR) repeat protein